MANLSKIRRDNMIGFLEQLKQQHTDDASIRAFNEIENHLLDKKYGLVWEEHSEEVDELLVDNIPVFSEVTSRRLCVDAELPWNFIIEGDNLQALYLLEKTHRGKIDCIYIDPPYNTGARDWKYNNDYVDKNNLYRHSKWLSMMNARIRIAKNLLKDDGVFICAIDENELGTTILLLEAIFGINYQIDPITIIHNPRGVQGDNFSYVNEYAIFVYKKGYKVIENQAIQEEDVDWSPLRNWGTESERNDAANCFYPIFVKDGVIVGYGDDVTSDDSVHPHQTEYDESTGVFAVYPIDVQGVERKWRYARQTVESISHLLRVKEIDGGYDIEIGKDFAPYRTVWTDKKYDANEYGTQLISSMVPNNDFTFPKSVYNTYECLRAVTLYRPDAIILDFFAGSGTTAHAALMLNQDLGGHRRFILCTNNDVGDKKEKEYKKAHGDIDYQSEDWLQWCEMYGIASSVTYPRVRAAIEGFVHTKDFKETLFQKKVTPSLIKNSKKTVDAINQLVSDMGESYDSIKWVVEDDTLKILGITKKGHMVAGIPANLKYYKCSWTDRRPEDYLLSNALCLHIKEMIEIQNSIEIDNRRHVLILNKTDFYNTLLNGDVYPQIEDVWVNQNIVFSAAEIKKLQEVRFRYIPREYFGEELKEAAE